MLKKIILSCAFLVALSACKEHHDDNKHENVQQHVVGNTSGSWKFRRLEDHFSSASAVMINERSNETPEQRLAYSCETHNNNSHLVSLITEDSPGMTRSFVNSYIPVEYRIDEGEIQKGKFYATGDSDGSVSLDADANFIDYLKSHENGNTLYFYDEVSSSKTSFPMAGFSDFSGTIFAACHMK